jgi:hypothetical protein
MIFTLKHKSIDFNSSGVLKVILFIITIEVKSNLKDLNLLY